MLMYGSLGTVVVMGTFGYIGRHWVRRRVEQFGTFYYYRYMGGDLSDRSIGRVMV